jgi:G protein beta subunit-like protein
MNDINIYTDQVIFVTGGYDHTIKIWEAHTGNCQRTLQHTDSVSFL